MDIENPERGRELHLECPPSLKIFHDLDIETPERGRERALYALSTYRISLDIGNPEKGSEH